MTDLQTFKEEIWDQPLWCNKYITQHVGQTKSVLYLRNWIRSGVNKISDLHFNDGRLDEEYIHNRIGQKQNIYSEIYIIKMALSPYRECLSSDQQNIQRNQVIYTSSKQYYLKLVELKTNRAEATSVYLSSNGFNQTQNMFISKVVNERENKIREFNYKVLHGVLACNKNLKKWKLRDSSRCDACEGEQSIKHLLYECPYIQPLFDKIKLLFRCNITYETLLGNDTTNQFNPIFSLVLYLIYKEWVTMSWEHKDREQTINLGLFKEELAFRNNIYKKCNGFSDCIIANIDVLVNGLTT